MTSIPLTSREARPEGTIVGVGSAAFGGKRLVVIAGPCAVEGEEQVIATARLVKAAGAALLRGGAYKPRTSPYQFQGLREDGLQLLAREVADKLDGHDEKSLAEAIYRVAGEAGLDAKQLFKVVYRALIEKDQGPRLAGFLLILGRERVLELLRPYGG